jgi:hypothetical protein
MKTFIFIFFICAALTSAVYAQALASTLIKGAEGTTPTAYYELLQEANALRHSGGKSAASDG